MTKFDSHRGGFTLIEVLVATGLLMAAVTFTTAAIVRGQRFQRDTTRRMGAAWRLDGIVAIAVAASNETPAANDEELRGRVTDAIADDDVLRNRTRVQWLDDPGGRRLRLTYDDGRTGEVAMVGWLASGGLASGGLASTGGISP